MELAMSALRVMNVLWDRGNTSAKDIATVLGEDCGWNKNTTYTIIHQCIKKNLIERLEPDFICRALISREGAQASEVSHLIESMFKGSPRFFASALISNGTLSKEDVEEMQRLIQTLE